MEKNKFAVALSGGGIKSVAEAGILQRMYEAGLKPSMFCGTSGGSIVAALLALNYRPTDVFSFYKKFARKVFDPAIGHIFKGIFTTSYIEGIIRGKRLENSLHKIILEWLGVCKPLAIITTNIDTGEEVVFSTYDFRDIDGSKIVYKRSRFYDYNYLDIPLDVRASCSLPGVFVPTRFAGEKLVDGGLVSNLPADFPHAVGYKKVVAIDLGYSGKTKTKGIFSILRMSLDIIERRTTVAYLNDQDLYLNPKVYDIDTLDIGKIDECFSRGYEYADSNIDKIKDYVGSTE